MRFRTSKSFGWGLERCVPHYYQVNGRCPPSASSAACPAEVQVTVQACSVDEACRKVRERNLGMSVDRIIMFTRGSVTGSPGNPTDYRDVTPDPDSCGDCCGLLGGNTGTAPQFVPEARSNAQEAPPPPRRPPRERSLRLAPPENVYWGSGVVESWGSGALLADDLGILVESFNLGGDLTSVATTDYAASAPAPAPVDRRGEVVRPGCCSAEVPVALLLRHNLAVAPPLGNFLRANALSVPDFIKLTYLPRTEAWSANLHYEGQSAVGSGAETWDLSVQTGCRTDWYFSLVAVNTRGGRQRVSRVLAHFDAARACGGDRFDGLSFGILGLAATPVASQPVVSDGLLFRNLRLAFRILPDEAGSLLEVVDESAAFAATLTGG